MPSVKNTKKVSVQPPLGSTIERFGPERQMAGPVFEIISSPTSARCWYIDESEQHLVQVQNGRFILNWRKVEDDDQYPHYPQLRTEFEAEWNRFSKFLIDNDLGQPRVLQCEVTYVNHINRGSAWQSFDDLPKVIPAWSGQHSGHIPTSTRVGWLNVRYLMPGNQGRLHVALQHALRKTDAQETIQLTLTARGAPKSSDMKDILASFDLGREWVVCGFTDFTSESMHKIWRRKQ